MKRLLDIIGSIIAILVFLPLFILISIAIKLTSPGPVFYRWPVVGKNGRPFRAYKFRTMVVGADLMKKELLDKNEAVGPVFKMRNDPRVTFIGRILRKFSLDELPQLWNILKGDMSLVGPRPVLDYEWAQFNEEQKRKLTIKPGAVCLWHIRGQPRDIDEWVRLDIEYIEKQSIGLDLKILLGAVWYIISGKNY